MRVVGYHVAFDYAYNLQKVKTGASMIHAVLIFNTSGEFSCIPLCPICQLTPNRQAPAVQILHLPPTPHPAIPHLANLLPHLGPPIRRVQLSRCARSGLPHPCIGGRDGVVWREWKGERDGDGCERG